MVRGSIKHNKGRKRTRLRFSSDGDPKVTYACKLDDEKFNDCKLIYKVYIAKFETNLVNLKYLQISLANYLEFVSFLIIDVLFKESLLN